MSNPYINQGYESLSTLESDEDFIRDITNSLESRHLVLQKHSFGSAMSDEKFETLADLLGEEI